MRSRSLDLVGVILFTALIILAALAGVDHPLVRVPSAIALVLAMPGYALLAAIFPGQELRHADRFLFSVGLSLVISALGGLALHLTPWGLNRITWTVLLSGAALAASFAALARRRRFPLAAPQFPGLRIRVQHLLLFGLAALITVGALELSRAGARLQWQRTQGTTQLWILPAGPAPKAEVLLGIQNIEFKPMQYRLVLQADGQNVQEWPSINLGAGEQWETVLKLPAEEFNGKPVEALVYRLDEPESIYRRVRLWPDP